MAVDPYKAYSEMYQKRTDAINAQTKQAETERLQREQAAQKTLESSNRGVYTTYKNAINPYGRMASQNNFSQGVSDYYNNASYGTMLQGLGANQYNYNDAMNNSNSLWQNYLAQKAGQEADALNDYNAGVLAQQKYDKEQEDAERERQEAIRQFNLKLELQKAQEAEDKRRYDQEWAYRLEQDKLAAQRLAASSGGSGGSSRSGSNPGIEIPDEEPATKTYNSTVGAQDPKKSVYVVSSKTTASSIPGKAYKDIKYSDGTTKRTIVNVTPTVATNKKTGGAAQIRNSAKSSSGYAKR